MKKENGFTLSELLGVIIILALLALIIGRSVVKNISEAKGEISASQEKAILNAAEKWAVDNSDRFDDIEAQSLSVGLDVLYIVDVSGSMRKTLVGSKFHEKVGTTRYYYTIDAINASMEALQSPNNEIMIATFGTNTRVPLPLASYASSTGEFFYVVDNANSYSSGSIYNSSAVKSSPNLRKVTKSGEGNITEQKVSQVTINFNEGDTKTQMGIYNAVDKFLESRSSQEAKNRIPVIILITDGYPSGNNTYSSSLCSVCSSADRTSTGLKSELYYAMMAGYEVRKRVENYYSDSTMFFYTIGFGIDENLEAKMILNPGSYEKLKKWNYVTKAFQQEGMTASDLQNAFSQITNEVIEAAQITQVCVTVEDLYNGGYLTTKEVKLADGQSSSEYVIMSMNEATNQYTFSMAKTEEQKKQCQALLTQPSQEE